MHAPHPRARHTHGNRDGKQTREQAYFGSVILARSCTLCVWVCGWALCSVRGVGVSINHAWYTSQLLPEKQGTCGANWVGSPSRRSRRAFHKFPEVLLINLNPVTSPTCTKNRGCYTIPRNAKEWGATEAVTPFRTTLKNGEHLECVWQSRSPVRFAKRLRRLRVGDIGLRSPVGTAGPSSNRQLNSNGRVEQSSAHSPSNSTLTAIELGARPNCPPRQRPGRRDESQDMAMTRFPLVTSVSTQL